MRLFLLFLGFFSFLTLEAKAASICIVTAISENNSNVIEKIECDGVVVMSHKQEKSTLILKEYVEKGYRIISQVAVLSESTPARRDSWTLLKD